MINTVKDLAEITSPTVLTGYLVNGNTYIPLVNSNRDYQEVQEWVSEGNTPEPAFTFEELQAYKITELHGDVPVRPRVFVLLEDTSEIYIWGAREDQFDIGDRYELMKEDSVLSMYLKDADDNVLLLGHIDVKRCYKAITIHRQNVIEYQWTKEAEIMTCSTQEELGLITWDIP